MLRIGHAGGGERPLETAALLANLAEREGTNVLVMRLEPGDINRALGDILVPCLSKRVRLVVEVPQGDPLAVANALAALAARRGQRRPRLGLVEGHDLLATQPPALLASLPCDPPMAPDLAVRAAVAPLGAEPLLGLIAKGSEILVTGRLAVSAAAIAFARHAYRWPSDAYDKLAAAAAIGRILAAGAASVGGDLDDAMPVACLPFADIAPDGTALFQATHARPVRVAGLALALLDGLRAPGQWVEPDVLVDLGEAVLEGPRLSGVAGRAAPDWLVGEFAFDGSLVGEAEASYGGTGAGARALAAASDLEDRLAALPGDARWRVEIVGLDAAAKTAGERVRDLAVAPSRDVRVRLAVRGQTQAPIHAALLEFQAMTVFGSAGAALLRATQSRERRIANAQVPKDLVTVRATQIASTQ